MSNYVPRDRAKYQAISTRYYCVAAYNVLSSLTFIERLIKQHTHFSIITILCAHMRANAGE